MSKYNDYWNVLIDRAWHLGWVSALCVLFTFAYGADDKPEESTDDQIGFVDKATGFVDNAQLQATERFVNFMARVDGFFGDAETSDDAFSNASWARIRLDARQPGGGDFDLKPSLKVRIVLPQTERRFKLLFSTEDDDTDIVGNNIGQNTSAGSDSSQNASFAIRFIRSARANGDVNLDFGVRQRESEIQYFTRLNTSYLATPAHHWDAGIANNYYYYNKSGFENRLSFAFTRRLFGEEDLFFRSFTEFNWRKGRKGAVIGQTLGFYSPIGTTKSIAFELLAGYHTALNTGVEDRFRGHEFRIRWRHNIWRPWFFYELWPSVSWPSVNDYERSYGGLIRVEAVIGQR